MNRSRTLCKTAVAALVWVVLTTPLTTLPLLQLADRPGTAFQKFASTTPYAGTAALVGLILIGLPVVGTFLASAALKRVSASWTPMRGGGYAKTALMLGVISALAATFFFVSGLLAR